MLRSKYPEVSIVMLRKITDRETYLSGIKVVLKTRMSLSINGKDIALQEVEQKYFDIVCYKVEDVVKWIEETLETPTQSERVFNFANKVVEALKQKLPVTITVEDIED